MKILFKIIKYALLMAFVVVVAFPIVYTILSSFKSNIEIMAGDTIIPKKFVLENYKQAWKLANFGRYTWNSIYLSFFTVIGVVLTSSFGGYVFARGQFKGKKLIFAIFTSLMFMSFGSLTLYPLLQIAKALHINKGLWGVILISVFGVNITNIYLIRGYINAIPKELDEAAQIDGCNFFSIFVRVIAPLLKPIIATVSLLTFKAAWNNYLLPMVFTLGNRKNSPLIVGIVSLKSTGAAAASWNLMMAGTVISIVPIIAIFLCFNRFFINGLSAGAVKG